MEEYVLQLGIWKSLEELEDNVSVDELNRFYIMKQKQDYEEKAFAASLKGVKMDPFKDPNDEERVSAEDVKRRAEKKRQMILQGKNPDDYDNIDDDAMDMLSLGFGIG